MDRACCNAVLVSRTPGFPEWIESYFHVLQVRDGGLLPRNDESDAPASLCAKLGARSVDGEILPSSARRGKARLTEVDCATKNGG